MLTDRQREKCREIAAALDRHDQGPWLKAEPSLSVEQKGLIWDLRAHVVAAGGRGRKKNPDANSSQGLPKRDTGMTSAGVADLDYWSDTDDPPDDDVSDDQPTCSGCRGTGKGRDGGVCQACGGTGVAPDDREDEPDDDEKD